MVQLVRTCSSNVNGNNDHPVKSLEAAPLIDRRIQERRCRHAVEQPTHAAWRTSEKAALISEEGKCTQPDSCSDGCFRLLALLLCWRPGIQMRLHWATIFYLKMKLPRVLIPRPYNDTRDEVKSKLWTALEDRRYKPPRFYEWYLDLVFQSRHFPSVKFEMTRFTLNTRYLQESHKALNTAASLEQ